MKLTSHLLNFCRTRKKLFHYLITLFVIVGCSNNEPPADPFSTIDKSNYLPDYMVEKMSLIKDIDQYLELINEVHCDPYRLISYSDLRRDADSLKSEILSLPLDSIHILDCYYFLQLLASQINDGHTMIRKPPNWVKLFPSIFPLIIQELNDTSIIIKDLGKEQIPKNAELISINGYKIKEMKARSIKYISRTLKDYRNVAWAKEFPFLLQTYFKFQSPWIIEYKFEKEVFHDTIKGLSPKEYIDKSRNKYYSNLINIKTALIDSVNIPILEVNAFNYNSYPVYTSMIDSFFTINKNRKNLVIDVRDNPGGNGLWSMYILDYFTNTEYLTYNVYKNRISRQFKKWAKYQLNSSYYSQGKSPFLFWYYRLIEHELYFKDILKSKNQEYVELDEQFQNPHQKTYDGSVYLLVSERTFSAGVVFASIFKCAKMGIVVGKESGGRIGFNCDPIDIELKNTKLTAKIPTAILVLPCGDPDSGLIPDIPVNITINEMQNNIDPYLLKIIEEIKKN